MIDNVKTALLLLRADKRGVTAMEYGLIAAATAVTIIAALSTLGPKLTAVFNKIATSMPTVS